MKEDARYIGFEVNSSENTLEIDKSDFIFEMKQICLKLFNKNYHEFGIYLVRFDGKKGIVKCKHTEKENIIKLLKSIKKISSFDVDINTLGTSGTIKSLIKKHL